MTILIIAAVLHVLSIGNSFSKQMAKSMPPIAKDLGLELDICSMYIGGCSLERHMQNVRTPDKAPYLITRNRCGVVDKETKANIPDMLVAEKWDVVTIQQASHDSWKESSYHPSGDELIAVIKKLAPQAKILVHETWSYTPFDKRLAKWKLDQNQMYEKLHAAYSAFAAQYGLEVIPTGTAVQRWRKELPVSYSPDSLGGDVVGSAKFVTNESGAIVPKGDVFHMGPTGNYLQALVWTDKIFGVDVTKCSYAPKGVGFEPARVALMKKIAHAVVKGE